MIKSANTTADLINQLYLANHIPRQYCYFTDIGTFYVDAWQPSISFNPFASKGRGTAFVDSAISEQSGVVSQGPEKKGESRDYVLVDPH